MDQPQDKKIPDKPKINLPAILQSRYTESVKISGRIIELKAGGAKLVLPLTFNAKDFSGIVLNFTVPNLGPIKLNTEVVREEKTNQRVEINLMFVNPDLANINKIIQYLKSLE